MTKYQQVADADAASGADEIERERRARQSRSLRQRPVTDSDPQRAAYLQKRCTCGSGLGDGLCANCWPV